MRAAPKTATTTAPNAAERQSFPDNLIAELGAFCASDYRAEAAASIFANADASAAGSPLIRAPILFCIKAD